jgi:hypothetical protein
MQPLYAVVGSGFTVSGDIDLRQKILVALACPVVDSCQLAFQGNFDQTSANFMRVHDPRFAGSADMRFQVGAGSMFVCYPRNQGVATPAWMRLETIMGGVGSAQTSPRTLTLLTVPRGIDSV